MATSTIQTKRTLLWTNPSSSNFTAQTIDLDLSGYEFIEVEFKLTSANTTHFFTKARVGTNFRLQTIEQVHSTNPINVRERACSSTTTGVTIGASYVHITGASTSSQDDAIIYPYHIYGIK